MESSPAPEPRSVPPALGFAEATSPAVAAPGPEYPVEASVASGQALAVGESPGSAPAFEVFSPVPPPISSTPTSPAPFAQGDHAAAAADSALPARRIVQFSDVPVAGAVVTRPTETTTARSALTAAASVPSRHPWSLIGAGVAVLLLLILAVATTGGDNEPRAAVGASSGSEDSRVDAVDQVAPSPPPVVAPTPAKKRTINRRSAAAASPKAASTAVKRPVRSAAVGQSVDLEALPVLSADADAPSEPSARAASTAQVRSASKPAGKTNTNIFNQAKNLAQKRATQRSGQVKTGSGD